MSPFWRRSQVHREKPELDKGFVDGLTEYYFVKIDSKLKKHFFVEKKSVFCFSNFRLLEKSNSISHWEKEAEENIKTRR